MAKAKDLRVGQELWLEWQGLWSPEIDSSILYYTIDHIDIENDLVKRALASTLQRDGIFDSLGDAFKAIDSGIPNLMWVGTVADYDELEICNSLGETEYGDVLENIQEITCVEVQK